jgi:hypothetical protein
MECLSIKETSILLSITTRAVRERLYNGCFGKEEEGFFYINGRGKAGKVIKIALESLPAEAQARYRGEQEEKDRSILLKIPKTKRDPAYHKEYVLQQYYEFAANYPNSDYLEAFLKYHNEELYPEQQITRRQLTSWNKAYKEKGIAGIIDGRGGSNKGKSSISEKAQNLFLKLWLTEKGTGCGGPSVEMCFRAVKFAFPNEEIPSVHSFRRLANSVPYPTKVYHREGKKAFADKCQPYIKFDYYSISTNEQWVCDTHTFDVLVEFPDGDVGRPSMVGFLDRRSRYLTGYGVLDRRNSNSDDINDVLFSGVTNCGKPGGLLRDNGRDYKKHDLLNKESAYSLVNQLDIDLKSAIPYNAKAKHIERFFRTLEECYCIGLDCYIGSDPKRRPEELKKIGSKLKAEGKLMKFDAFVKFIDASIEIYHNTPHRGHGMDGKTPKQAFVDFASKSKPTIIIPPEQLALYFLRSSRLIKVGRNGVNVPELGHYYDSKELYEYQGKKIYARYSTKDVRKVYCFDEQEQFICIAQGRGLGNLEPELTAQANREINSQRKSNRKKAREFAKNPPSTTFEQIAIEKGHYFEKVEVAVVPTVKVTNLEKHKQVKAIKSAERKLQLESKPDIKAIRTQEYEDELFFNHMAQGG